MSYAELDRRVARLERIVTDIEDGYGNSILELRRDVTGVQLANSRLFDGMNILGSGVGQIMAHLGLAPIGSPVATPPTDAEIDAAFEEKTT